MSKWPLVSGQQLGDVSELINLYEERLCLYNTNYNN